ncbi:endonuclease domain-containing protein [Hyphococcus sp.]|uniref:endonuclease domain-containing protein n=1 Tax=Hyphococcus sp. TaxID=2038636 RepID=UPI0035C684D8
MKPAKPQIKRARHLRQTANLPEQRAWSALRTLRKHGFPVRRQHPIGPYVVDFAIVRERLVIEIDGGVHPHHPLRGYFPRKRGKRGHSKVRYSPPPFTGEVSAKLTEGASMRRMLSMGIICSRG